MTELTLREAHDLRKMYRGIATKEADDTAIEGDYVDIRFRAKGDRIETFLCIWKDGAQAARVPVSNANIKKFKKEFERLRTMIGVEKRRIEG